MKIAIAGHVNVGKTTLFRNLLRKEVGEIADRSNVTTEVLSILDEKSGITFMDCPGFNEAGRILEIYNLTNDYDHFKCVLEDRNLTEDYEAIEGIKKADIVYYVTSSDRVHDRGYDSELELIRTFNTNVIGVLNRSNVTRQGESTVFRNIAWKSFFKKHGVDLVSYDFFYDKPAKFLELLQKSVETFKGEQKKVFYHYLSDYSDTFNKRCDELSDNFRIFRKYIEQISRVTTIRTNQTEEEKSEIISDITNSIHNYVVSEMEKCVSDIVDLFGSRGDLTMKSSCVRISEKIIGSDRLDTGIIGGVSGAVAVPYFGVIGSLNVASATGAAFVMPALGPLFIGGAFLGFVASQFLTPTKTKELKFILNEKEKDTILETLFTYLWIAANNGFANENNFVDEKDSSDIQLQVSILMSKFGLYSESGTSGYRGRSRLAIKELTGI